MYVPNFTLIQQIADTDRCNHLEGHTGKRTTIMVTQRKEKCTESANSQTLRGNRGAHMQDFLHCTRTQYSTDCAGFDKALIVVVSSSHLVVLIENVAMPLLLRIEY